MESAKTGRRSWELTKKAAADVRGGRRSCKDAYTTAKNLADGNCALWAVFFFALLDGGMDAQSAEEVLFMKGAKPVARKAMTDFLILCRQCIVDYTRLSGKMFYSAKGRAKTEEEVNELLCSSGEITCHSEWELTILLVNGYFDVSGVCVLGELMGLPDTQVVQEYATGLVNVLSAESPPPKSNLVMHRGKHFEALVPKVNFSLVVVFNFILISKCSKIPPMRLYSPFLAFCLVVSPGKHAEAQRYIWSPPRLDLGGGVPHRASQNELRCARGPGRHSAQYACTAVTSACQPHSCRAQGESGKRSPFAKLLDLC